MQINLPPSSQDLLIIDTDSVLKSIVTAKRVVITNAAKYRVYGILTGDVIVEKGCEFVLHGTMNGTVSNYGNCRIYGTVNGSISDLEKGSSVIDLNAVIKPLS